jgi:hypothetical protein
MTHIELKLSPQTYQAIVMALKEMPWRIADPALREIDPQVRAALVKNGQPDLIDSSQKAEEPK